MALENISSTEAMSFPSVENRFFRVEILTTTVLYVTLKAYTM